MDDLEIRGYLLDSSKNHIRLFLDESYEKKDGIAMVSLSLFFQRAYKNSLVLSRYPL